VLVTVLKFFRRFCYGSTPPTTDHSPKEEVVKILSESEGPPKKKSRQAPAPSTTRKELILDYSRLSSQTAWLNDDCIDGYLTRLAMENPGFGFLSTLTMTEDNLAKFLNSKRNASQKKMLEEKRKIAFAMVLESHWYAVMIDLDKKHIFCVDGFNSQARHEECFERARILLSKIDSSDYATQSLVIPRQNNASDCGVVACYYFKHFSKGILLEQLQLDNSESTERNYGFFRLSMRETIEGPSAEASTSAAPSASKKRKRRQ
jgi:hypothetical protein